MTHDIAVNQVLGENMVVDAITFQCLNEHPSSRAISHNYVISGINSQRKQSSSSQDKQNFL